MWTAHDEYSIVWARGSDPGLHSMALGAEPEVPFEAEPEVPFAGYGAESLSGAVL